jgi:tRNA A37 threonylcarbamoyladenosine synthetase subunit TsaC/SUA5/YrdC
MTRQTTQTVVPSVEVDEAIRRADEAYDVIRRGGLALVPADIGYGLLGHSRASIEQMYVVKGRRYDNPAIVAGSIDTLLAVGKLPDPALVDWLREVTASATLAAVVRVDDSAPQIAGLDPWVREVTLTRGTAAIFMNTGVFVDHLVERALADRLLLVGSSGNLSGTGNNYRFDDVPESIREGVDFVYDMGPMRFANDAKYATTIVNLTNFTIRRIGVSYEEIVTSYEAFAARRPDIPRTLTHMPRRDGGRRPAKGVGVPWR